MQGRSRYGAVGVDNDPIALEDLTRRLHDVVRSGRVVEVDAEAEKVRVRLGGTVTDWLRWGELEADEDATWNPPAVGTAVTVLSQGGDLANGVVVARFRQKRFPSPSNDPQVKARKVGKTVQTYDKASDTLTLEMPEAGTLQVKIGGALFRMTKDAIELSIGSKSVKVTEAAVLVNGTPHD